MPKFTEILVSRALILARRHYAFLESSGNPAH